MSRGPSRHQEQGKPAAIIVLDVSQAVGSSWVQAACTATALLLASLQHSISINSCCSLSVIVLLLRRVVVQLC